MILLVYLITIWTVFNASIKAESTNLNDSYFLHVTDFHIDPLYQPQTSPDNSCHRPNLVSKKSLLESNLSSNKSLLESNLVSNKSLLESNLVIGPYGAPLSFCDSPPKLINLTIDHLIKKHAQNVSFIVYTGDAARHDSDPNENPRTWQDIQDAQYAITRKLQEVAAVSGIPVVPSIGNNDIPEHNRLEYSKRPGENKVLEFFSEVWRPFIPADQLPVFQTLGSFYVRVRSDLVVVSLNTLYWLSDNSAVTDCVVKRGRKSGKTKVAPGLEIFRWLEETVLSPALAVNPYTGEPFVRYKVMLTGHIPPNVFNLYPMCYSLYSDISRRYNQVLLPGIYGHMNLDHFLFVRASELYAPSKLPLDHFRKQYRSTGTVQTRNDVHRLAGVSYLEYLMGQYERIYKLKYNATDLAPDQLFGVALVSGSVVPLYNPSFRVFSLSLNPVFGLYMKGYDQFFMNLTAWNALYKMNGFSEVGLAPPKYKFAYGVTNLFDMKSLQPNAIARTAGKIEGEYCASKWNAYKFPPNPHRKLCHVYFKRWFEWYAVATGATF